MTSKCLALVLVFAAFRARALPMPVQVAAGRISPPLQSGVSVGGKAGAEFTLIGAQAEPGGQNGERVSFSYGDPFGNQQKGEPGFFHVAVDRDGRRVVIDLAQIRRTAVDPQKLARVLGASKLVESSEMTTDPVDGSTNITLNMKSPVLVRVTASDGGPARLVVELEPVGTAVKGKRF